MMERPRSTGTSDNGARSMAQPAIHIRRPNNSRLVKGGHQEVRLVADRAKTHHAKATAITLDDRLPAIALQRGHKV